MTVTAIWRYPVKSMAGERVGSTELTETGQGQVRALCTCETVRPAGVPDPPPMRLGGLPERIPRRDGHADPAIAEVTTQLVEFTRIRDRVEGMHAERAPLHRNRFDAVRVDDASLWPDEVETPLELGTSGERKRTIQPVVRTS